MRLDGAGLPREVEDFRLGQHKGRAFGARGRHVLHRLASRGGSDHLDSLAPRLFQDRRQVVIVQEGLEDLVFVGRDDALDNVSPRPQAALISTVLSKPDSVSIENITPDPPVSERTIICTPTDSATSRWSKPCTAR
jgi:hypothetical protein